MYQFHNNGIQRITSVIEKNVQYTVFIKIRYSENKFFMAGNQFGFLYSSQYDIDNLAVIINARLEDYFQEYNLQDGDIVYIQLLFRKFDVKLQSEFSIDDIKRKDGLLDMDITLENNTFNIPVSISDDYLGKPIDVTIENDFIVNIPITINGKKQNFLDLIKARSKVLSTNHKDKIDSYDSGFKFYLLRDYSEYVLAIKSMDDSFTKIRYSLSGVIISKVTDSVYKEGSSPIGINLSNINYPLDKKNLV